MCRLARTTAYAGASTSLVMEGRENKRGVWGIRVTFRCGYIHQTAKVWTYLSVEPEVWGWMNQQSACRVFVKFTIYSIAFCVWAIKRLEVGRHVKCMHTDITHFYHQSASHMPQSFVSVPESHGYLFYLFIWLFIYLFIYLVS